MDEDDNRIIPISLTCSIQWRPRGSNSSSRVHRATRSLGRGWWRGGCSGCCASPWYTLSSTSSSLLLSSSSPSFKYSSRKDNFPSNTIHQTRVSKTTGTDYESSLSTGSKSLERNRHGTGYHSSSSASCSLSLILRISPPSTSWWSRIIFLGLECPGRRSWGNISTSSIVCRETARRWETYLLIW